MQAQVPNFLFIFRNRTNLLALAHNNGIGNVKLENVEYCGKIQLIRDNFIIINNN